MFVVHNVVHNLVHDVVDDVCLTTNVVDDGGHDVVGDVRKQRRTPTKEMNSQASL